MIATHHRVIPLWLVAFTVRGAVSHQQFAPVYTPVPAAVVVVAIATVIVISIAFTTHNIGLNTQTDLSQNIFIDEETFIYLLFLSITSHSLSACVSVLSVHLFSLLLLLLTGYCFDI